MKDLEGFLAECRQGREMGFDGKTLIHPGQVDGVPTRPSRRREQTSTTPAASSTRGRPAHGRGVVTYDGRMVENLHVDVARRILATDEAIRARS